MRHVLITGGKGYIGNHLTKSFLEDGWTVSTLDSDFNSAADGFDFSGYTKQLKRYKASVANHDIVSRALRGVDVVYHLAARMDWSSNPKQSLKLSHVNVYGTTVVLNEAWKAGVGKVIFSSSAAVYGNIVPAAETDPCMPVNMYGATKLAAEGICRGFYELGLEIVILRFANVWGGKFSNSVVNKFANGSNTMYGDGDQTRDFVHITDIIKALRAAADWDSNIYNIGTGDEVTVSGLWERLHSGEPPQHQPPTFNEIFRSCLDMSYTFSKTGWRPMIRIAELSKEEIIKYCGTI